MTIGRITIDDLQLIELEVDPTTGGGVDAPIGSLGLSADGTGTYYKSGSDATAWTNLKNFNIDLFNNTTRHTSNLRFYTRTLNTGTNGIITLNPTNDGSASGTALFTSILSISAIAEFNPGNVYQAPFFVIQSIAGDLRTVTMASYRGRSEGILIGGTVTTLERAVSGIPSRITIIGLSA